MTIQHFLQAVPNGFRQSDRYGRNACAWPGILEVPYRLATPVRIYPSYVVIQTLPHFELKLNSIF